MSEPLTFKQVCDKFAKLGIEQRVPIIKNDTQEQASDYLASYVSKLLQGKDFMFTVDPEVFMKEAYKVLEISSFPWVKEATDTLKAQLDKVTDKVTAMFLDAMNIYMLRCQVHASLLEYPFDEPVNYFVKKSEKGVSPLQGPFQKIPSTFFGSKPLDFWDMEFPEDSDLIIAYTNEGFLRMIMRYKGKAITHY